MAEKTYADAIRERGEKLRAAGEEERAEMVFTAARKLDEAHKLEQEAHAQKKKREGGLSIFARLFRFGTFQLSSEAKYAMARNIRKQAEDLLDQAGIQ